MELPAVFDAQQRDTMRAFMARGMLKLEKVMKNQLAEMSWKLQ